MKFDVTKSSGLFIVLFLGLSIYVVFTLGALAGNYFEISVPPASKAMIRDWRKVSPGMPLEDVVEAIGKTGSMTSIGGNHPNEAKRCASEEYLMTHGSLLYLYTPQPVIMIVFFDENDRVTFVSTTGT